MESSPTPEQEAQIEALVDQGVDNYYSARIAVTGIDRAAKTKTTSQEKHTSRGDNRTGEGDRDIAISPGNMIGDEDSKQAYLRHRDDILRQEEELMVDRLNTQVAAGELTQSQANAIIRTLREKRNRT